MQSNPLSPRGAPRLSGALAFTVAGLALALVSGLVLPRIARADKDAAEAAIAEMEEELDQAFGAILSKKKKKALGQYHFVRAINLYRAALFALGQKTPEGVTDKDGPEPNEDAALIFISEGHDHVQWFFARNKKRFKDESEDKALARKAAKEQKKMRYYILDAFLEPVEATTPEGTAFHDAKDWREVIGVAKKADD